MFDPGHAFRRAFSWLPSQFASQSDAPVGPRQFGSTEHLSIEAIAAFAAGLPGALILWLFSPGAVAFLCALVFGASAVASLRVPVTTVAASPEGVEEKAELRSAGVLSASSAMGTLRWVVGFVTFLLAFALRGADTTPALGSITGRAIAIPGATVELR